MKVNMKKLLDHNDIIKKNKELVDLINSEYKDKDLVLVGIMNGALLFMMDIINGISFDFILDTISCSSYMGKKKSSGKVNYKYDTKVDLFNKDVLILEDIVDTGKTIKKVIDDFKKRNPKTIKVATLFLRNENKKKYKLLWYGYKLRNEFVVGYGLDYDERYRNLKDVFEVV
ncbi:MAG: hypoxanthine phosphoribosyltransferase [Candidatus Marinimicrobia bacterium]|nr:hypoxanthine phosphoribosyltransferase [Candidatus Neomarinimicrobiota bacterium]|tara:strand:+ start:5482 stop:5997 length:516 start_codon:yes stop_codon:yes gene_type:complete